MLDLIKNESLYTDRKGCHTKVIQYMATVGMSRPDLPLELRSRLDAWLLGDKDSDKNKGPSASSKKRKKEEKHEKSKKSRAAPKEGGRKRKQWKDLSFVPNWFGKSPARPTCP